MGMRIGVDVGGTFTKAIAFDLSAGEVVAQAVVPTTHQDPNGVAAGVVQVVAEVAHEVGADAIELVVHSTTQAVNAILEGDTSPVGVIGLGCMGMSEFYDPKQMDEVRRNWPFLRDRRIDAYGPITKRLLDE